MAEVDFTNAVLEPYGNYLPMNYRYLKLFDSSGYTALFNEDMSLMICRMTTSILENTKDRFSAVYTGTAERSGTEAYLAVGYQSNPYVVWKISNINFSAGDYFSFIIDIETSGNV